MHALTPSRLTGISAVLPFLACGIGLVFAVAPMKPQATDLADVETAQTLLPATYLPIDAPLRVGLDGGRTQIAVNIAFVAHLHPADLLTVSGRVQERQEAVLASLTEILLAEATRNPDPAHLRQTLPSLLRDATNLGLDTPDIAEPVARVLILDLMITHG